MATPDSSIPGAQVLLQVFRLPRYIGYAYLCLCIAFPWDGSLVEEFI